jgi:hypothetical protein
MSVFKKTAVATATPTLEERSGAASATAASALYIFEAAAGDLERAANEFDAIRDEASAEVERLLSIKLAAHDDAYRNRVQAQKIRDLVGGE